jgi:hypothetical protein
MKLQERLSMKWSFIVLTVIFFCLASMRTQVEGCCAVRMTRWYGWPLSYMSISKEFGLEDPHASKWLDDAHHGHAIDMLREGWEFRLGAPDGSSNYSRPFPLDFMIVSILVDLIPCAIFSGIVMSFGFIGWYALSGRHKKG